MSQKQDGWLLRGKTMLDSPAFPVHGEWASCSPLSGLKHPDPESEQATDLTMFGAVRFCLYMNLVGSTLSLWVVVPQMKGREGPRQNRQNLAFLLSPDSGGKNFLRSYYSPFTSIPSPVSFRDRGGETPHLWTPHTYTHTLHKNCVPGKARKGAVISIKTSEISMEGK